MAQCLLLGTRQTTQLHTAGPPSREEVARSTREEPRKGEPALSMPA